MPDIPESVNHKTSPTIAFFELCVSPNFSQTQLKLIKYKFVHLKLKNMHHTSYNTE